MWKRIIALFPDSRFDDRIQAKMRGIQFFQKNAAKIDNETCESKLSPYFQIHFLMIEFWRHSNFGIIFVVDEILEKVKEFGQNPQILCDS